jgi:hypothetical protein
LELAQDCDPTWIENNTASSVEGAWASQAPVPLLRTKSYLVVCAFEKNGTGNWVKKSLKQIGVTSIRMVTKNSEVVNNTSVDASFAKWVAAASVLPMSLPARDLLERDEGRWARNARMAIEFQIEKSTPIPAWMELRKIGYFHGSLELANTYGFAFGDKGNAIAMPLVVALGGDWPVIRNSDFYLGVHALLSPTFKFAEGKISQVISAAVGARFDIGGYAGIGAGYLIDFTGDTKGNALIFLSIGSEIMKVLATQ